MIEVAMEEARGKGSDLIETLGTPGSQKEGNQTVGTHWKGAMIDIDLVRQIPDILQIVRAVCYLF